MFTGLLRQSFCSRFLYTLIPARCYNGDRTIFKLLETLADDCTALFRDGLDVASIPVYFMSSTGSLRSTSSK